METKDGKPKRKAETDMASTDERAQSDKPGYCNPPKEYQWPKGTSGNPDGRPKGRRNRKTVMKEIVDHTYTINVGNTQKKLDLVSANLLAHGLKGAKGDARSFNAFMKAAERLGLLEEIGADPDLQKAQVPALGGPTNNSPYMSDDTVGASDKLLENLRVELLTRDECIELSELCEVIDLGGDVTALSTEQFGRFKDLINKGRGKDVTPME